MARTYTDHCGCVVVCTRGALGIEHEIQRCRLHDVAPEALAALRELYRLLYDAAGGPEPDDDAGNAARDAIRKATGEA